MTLAKMKVEFDGFDKVISKLKSLDGDVRKVTEDALRETHSIMTQKAEDAMASSKLPAGGKYSKGGTLNSLVRNAQIEWVGDSASVQIGFDIEHGGLASIFLTHGTPRHQVRNQFGSPKRPDAKQHPGTEKDQALYNVFYGASVRKQVLAAQEQIFWNAIRRLER